MLRARIVMVPVVAMVAATLLTGAAQPQEAPVGGDMGLPSSSSSESSESRVAVRWKHWANRSRPASRW